MFRDKDWIAEGAAALMVSKQMLQSAETLTYPKERWNNLVFPESSELNWKYFLTSALPEDVISSKAIEVMDNQPLMF